MSPTVASRQWAKSGKGDENQTNLKKHGADLTSATSSFERRADVSDRRHACYLSKEREGPVSWLRMDDQSRWRSAAFRPCDSRVVS